MKRRTVALSYKPTIVGSRYGFLAVQTTVTPSTSFSWSRAPSLLMLRVRRAKGRWHVKELCAPRDGPSLTFLWFLLLAQRYRSGMSALWSISGDKRTCSSRLRSDENDPQRTL